MISHELDRNEGILIVSPKDRLQSSDFAAIASEADPYIEEKGGLNGLMIQAESFPGWKDFGALVSHLNFIRDHHRKIKRVAAVSDDKILSIMPHIVDHFVNAEVRHFQYSDKQAALDWLHQ